MAANGRVTVFGPHPMLSITIEQFTADGGDDIHVHAAGQGVWVARMAAELGATATLCGLIGGETGTALRPLLDRLPIELRLVETVEPSGCYVHDRRSGERVPVAQSASRPPTRHEIDDLFSVTCAAALDSGALALCGPYPGEALPLEIYGNLVADVRANGTPVVVDLSPPRLDSALEGRPNLVKINDWELARFVEGPVDTEARMRSAAERLLERGAEAAIITRAEQPALVLRGDEAWTLAPPRFERGAREGCGDSMMGGLAACMASGTECCASLRAPAPPTSCATGSAAPTARSSRTWRAGWSSASSTRDISLGPNQGRTGAKGAARSSPPTIARGALSSIHPMCGASTSTSRSFCSAAERCTGRPP
jgi:1-phosphofructokinase